MTQEPQTPTLDRLESQIGWYDSRSNYCQRMFKSLKFCEFVFAALVALAAGLDLPRYVTGLLGVLIVTLEGIQQLNQYNHNWLRYRSGCEALKHEKYLYLGRASVYATVSDPQVLLAERVESLISQEHAKWESSRKQASDALAGKSDR